MLSCRRDPVRARMLVGYPRLANKPREPTLIIRSREEKHNGAGRELKSKFLKVDWFVFWFDWILLNRLWPFEYTG